MGIDNKLTRLYSRHESAVFCKTREQWGGLSNFSMDFPLRINGIPVPTSEHLYQMLKAGIEGFDDPRNQLRVLHEKYPSGAKSVASGFRWSVFPYQWDYYRVRAMRWAIRIKLACNPNTFGELLKESSKVGGATHSSHIVELSTRDSFWGARPGPHGQLVGGNVLGRLLRELRDNYKLTGKIEMPSGEPGFVFLGKNLADSEFEEAIPGGYSAGKLPF